jgi:hypothetical protein
MAGSHNTDSLGRIQFGIPFYKQNDRCILAGMKSLRVFRIQIKESPDFIFGYKIQFFFSS